MLQHNTTGSGAQGAADTADPNQNLTEGNENRVKLAGFAFMNNGGRLRDDVGPLDASPAPSGDLQPTVVD